MAYKHTTIVDYGMGNIWSVLSALRYLGNEAVVSCDPDHVSKANCLILPGVGSFRAAMDQIRQAGMDEAILEAVKSRGGKILGICLGMQLLGAHGTEDGETTGIGLIPNRVDKFTSEETGQKKIPHIGFNNTHFSERDGLFGNFPNTADFYYVHSYRMLPTDPTARIATCSYGIEFLAAFELENICGTQFHPEKSQTNGLILLKNFLEL
jgi:imidazole glycerol-phosphate synthase subunit HisH